MEGRHRDGEDWSVMNRFQQKFWKTKQTFLRVSGQKEDQHVVASDAELDAKLELFHSVQRTCMELLKVVELYQRRVILVSQEENELGRFLRSQGEQDKRRAGKIMKASGKALCFSSQQRLLLTKPLGRLYQEVETFRYRAISDTWLTVNVMEQRRTEYRAALLWMKDVSQELDPDTHKHMERFRKVQAQVRNTKMSFDQLKSDVCQKVELLSASRCNLLSHTLTAYQTTLLHFWEKTSHTMAAIHESFRGCQQQEVMSQKTLKEARASKRKEKKVRSAVENTENTELRTPSPCCLDSSEESRDAFLEELLGSSSLDEGDFSQEWTNVFGTSQAAPTETQEKNHFLPSQLLDQFSSSDWLAMIPEPTSQDTEPSSTANQKPPPTDTKPSRSAWLDLFADLDPLANPDAVGRSHAEQELHKA